MVVLPFFKKWWHDFVSSLDDVKKSASIYWRAYGGITALISSPYLVISFVVAGLLSGFCYAFVDYNNVDYFGFILSVVPSLLGFTLAGYAILMSFGSEKFLKIISGEFEDGEPSPFMKANGAFVHFIVLQLLAVFAGLIGKILAIQNMLIVWFCYWIFFYSLLSGLAAAFAVLNMAGWFDDIIGNDVGEDK